MGKNGDIRMGQLAFTSKVWYYENNQTFDTNPLIEKGCQVKRYTTFFNV
ncbi:hypothetical protein [Paenibacillus sp. NPDC057934]